MQEDGVIDAEQVRQAMAKAPQLVAYERVRRDTGFYFLDDLGREAKAAAGIDILAGASYTIHSTIDAGLQRATEAALQEGLAAYERQTGRVRFNGPEANLADAVQRIEVERNSATADRREGAAPPPMRGAAVGRETKPGGMVAMGGGFSSRVSQLNRTTQMRGQPGSALKPTTYLAGLGAGLHPNTLVLDEPITFAPIGNAAFARERDYWSPRNYDRGSSGVVTLRRALENSKNRVTARLLDGAIKSSPQESLGRVCEIATEAQLYGACVRYYPFVLGAQPVRMVDLAAFYAAIANEGARPSPHAIDSIEQNGLVVYRHEMKPTGIGSADPAAFYQLKTMLQGVVERGTARPIRQLAPYVGGKTGTSENENDAWFVGFSNEVTIAVWVGYDNAGDKRRTLGSGETGAKVAGPRFAHRLRAPRADSAPRTLLSPPSPQARTQLVDLPVDLTTGDRLAYGGPRAFVEHFHLDGQGQVEDTQYRLVSRGEIYAYRCGDTVGEGDRPPGRTHRHSRPARPAA